MNYHLYQEFISFRMINKTHKPKSKSSRNNTENSSGGNGSYYQEFKHRLTSPSFSGRCSDLKGKICDWSTLKKDDKYIITTKSINNYDGRSINNSCDIRSSILNESLFSISITNDPDDNCIDIVDENWMITKTSREKIRYIEKKIFDLELGAHMKRSSMLESNIQNVYSLFLGKCTDLITTKFEISRRNFAHLEKFR